MPLSPSVPAPRAIPAALALALALAGCSGKTSDAGAEAVLGECSTCHGGPEGSAPPRSTKGTTSTADVRVGAHAAHLRAGPFRRAIACDECHVVPARVDSPGHLGGDRADVVFATSGLARARGAAPTWNGARCSATYCHGATLAGGLDPAPLWTVVDGTQVRCGSCHGMPPATTGSPPSPHPAVSGPVPAACSACHPGTVQPDGAIAVGGEQHIDGVVEVGGAACAGCHGDAARLPAAIAPAPPRDTGGGAATTRLGVGAHQAHLAGTTLRSAPIPCVECHDDVNRLSGHPDGAVGLRWGPLAKAGGTVPAWNRAAATCVTYCHGATLRGGAAPAPIWTKVDGTQVACTSCHGLPPPPPHVQDSACGSCHVGFTATTVDKDLHIDGYVELDLKTCVSCHGDARRPPGLQAAPPTDLSGDAATAALGVGAHQAHLTGTALSRPVACGECHPPVTSTAHAEGMGLVRQVEFGTLSQAGGAFPVWDRKTATCASTYCHGATLRGGAATTPVWTVVNGAQKRCDSCHGSPPPAPHPPRPDCDSCHPGYTPTSVRAATHIDGVLNVVTQRCTTCHGDATRLPATAAAAPPVDTHGGAAVAARGVGAHQRHLVDGALRRAIPCAECHAVPTVMNHATGAATVVFGPLAATGASTPTWDGTRCSGVYCHGAGLGGGTLKAPAWTTVDGTQAACGTCHGMPPPAPHTSSTDCGGCHAGYTASTVDPAHHVDGVVQATGSCTSCHGDPAAAAAVASAPPRDTKGNTAPTARGVGAHRVHLADGPLRIGVACTECHPTTNPATHPEGTLTVKFGPLASSGGAAPAWRSAPSSCASVYCHGATLVGGADPTPLWTVVTGRFSACTACHGNPPATPAHAGGGACSACHPGYTSQTVDPTTHVDGVVNATGGSCTSCHGDGARAGAGASAPPRDLAGNAAPAARGVGAHQVHLAGGPLAAAIACTECHPAPGTPHPRPGSPPATLAFGPLSSTSTTASWNGTALTCATYCHGATLGGGTLKAPVWTTVNGTQAACGTCHGLPPPKPHVQRTSCGACHPGTTATTVTAATHVDGRVQTVALTCTTCHGDPSRVLVTGADARAKAAPPGDTTGASGTTLRSVGAHLAHLNRGAGAIAAPTACTECHVVPSSNLHADGTPKVTFGARARTGNVTPTWNGTTCAGTYCHGNHANGLAAAPSWTAAGPLSCSTGCHAQKPNNANHTTYRHPGGNACNNCHKDTDATGSRITNPALHVNGRVDGVCKDCH